MAEGTGQMMGFRRGVAVLKIMARYPEGCSFSQIQKQLNNLPAPTLSRLLKVMQDENLVTKHAASGVYTAGSLAFNLSRRFLGRATLPEVIQPIIDKLAGTTGASAAYCEYENLSIIFLAVCNMPEAFHYMEVGAPNRKLIYHGFGQVHLAYMPDERRRWVVEQSPVSLPLPEDEYYTRLDTIRDRKHFVEFGESQEAITRVAAPVFKGKEGELAGVLGITVLAGHPPEEKLREYVQAVTAAAAEATEQIYK